MDKAWDTHIRKDMIGVIRRFASGNAAAVTALLMILGVGSPTMLGNMGNPDDMSDWKETMGLLSRVKGCPKFTMAQIGDFKSVWRFCFKRVEEAEVATKVANFSSFERFGEASVEGVESFFPALPISKLAKCVEGAAPSEDKDCKQAVWETALRTRDISGIFAMSEKMKMKEDELKDAIFMNVSARLKREKSIFSSIKSVCGFLDFLDMWVRKNPCVSKTGKESALPLAKYLDSVKARGRSVPATVRSALSVWAGALSIDWPVGDYAVLAACPKSAMIPKMAPMMPVDFLIKCEEGARNEEFPFLKRMFLAAVALMAHASLRFADAQAIASLWTNKSAIIGTLGASKTVLNSVQPWAAPRRGMRGVDGWHTTLVAFREKFKDEFGYFPKYLFPFLQKGWKEYSKMPARYHDTRKRLVECATEFGVEGAENLTLHSPRNLYPSLANQLGWSIEHRSKIGRWSGRSNMADHYDRNFCVTELKLRTDIQKKIVNGWRPPSAYEVPDGVEENLMESKPTVRKPRKKRKIAKGAPAEGEGGINPNCTGRKDIPP